MRIKKAADRLAFLFFTAMLLLTLFAEDIQQLTFPQVAGERLQKRDFPLTITLEDGTEIQTATPRNAVPVSLLKGNELWVLTESETSGVYLLEAVSVELGETFEGYTEIISGISARQLIFLGSDRETVPGDRVLLAADMAQKTGLSGIACAVVPAEDIPGGNSPSGEADGPAGGVSGRENIFPVFAEVREMGREYHVYAPAGLERVAYHEMGKRLPETEIRSPWLEKVRRQNASVLTGTAAVTILLTAGCIALRKRRFCWVRACALSGWLAAAGFLLKRFLVVFWG